MSKIQLRSPCKGTFKLHCFKDFLQKSGPAIIGSEMNMIPPPPPPPVTTLKIHPVTHKQISLNWKPSQNLQNAFDIYWRANSFLPQKLSLWVELQRETNPNLGTFVTRSHKSFKLGSLKIKLRRIMKNAFSVAANSESLADFWQDFGNPSD